MKSETTSLNSIEIQRQSRLQTGHSAGSGAKLKTLTRPCVKIILNLYFSLIKLALRFQAAHTKVPQA
jgi:hypothetical protein